MEFQNKVKCNLLSFWQLMKYFCSLSKMRPEISKQKANVYRWKAENDFLRKYNYNLVISDVYKHRYVETVCISNVPRLSMCLTYPCERHRLERIGEYQICQLSDIWELDINVSHKLRVLLRWFFYINFHQFSINLSLFFVSIYFLATPKKCNEKLNRN